MFMALLTYLREFQKSIAYPELRTHRKRSEIESFYYDVLAKGSVVYISSPCTESIYLFNGKKADLSVPLARVCIALNAPVRNESYRRHLGLLCALLFTYAYSNYFACAAHIPNLLSVT